MQPPKNTDFYSSPGLARSFAIRRRGRGFYGGALGLAFEEDANGYLHTGGREGVGRLAGDLRVAAELARGLRSEYGEQAHRLHEYTRVSASPTWQGHLCNRCGRIVVQSVIAWHRGQAPRPAS
jgi:hypothetical protein